MDSYDCIVVGAGIEGSGTAYQLAKSGKKTLLLEQFSLLHANGSSHGRSRLTRRAYSDECFAMLMEEAGNEWRELEKLSGQSIYIKTGCIQFVKNESELQKRALTFLHKYKAPHKILDAKSLKKQYPHYHYAEDYNTVFDEDGGVILADKALSAFHEQFRKFGGKIIDNCSVLNLKPGDTVTVETSKGNFTTKAVVLCMGCWIGQFAQKLGLELPVQPTRPSFMYWKEAVPGSHTIQNGMVAFIDLDTDIYGFPSLEFPGLVKICFDGGIEFDITKPDDDDDKPPVKLDELCQYVKDHFPGLETKPTIVDKCKYTVTPDHHFILDRHPNYKNIVIGAGFSGKGFKFAPVVGTILRDLVLDQPLKYDIRDFSIKRF